MADDVPVCDVLCEATEYLSKLGSNLRVRTDNLKDKRIRKDKLKNSHAVKKAANKVLLICELSKKSIENVEAGIKKILSHISTNQTIGGKNSENKIKISNGKNLETDYFIYKSRKLRIRKKVNLKHYMSVKVNTACMSKELQEKYPVYHDCKLYRLRKRKDKVKDHTQENVIETDNSNKILLETKLSLQENPINDNKVIDTTLANKDKTNLVSQKQIETESQVEKLEVNVECNEDGKKSECGSDKNDNKKLSRTVSRKKKKFKHIKVVEDSSSDNNSDKKSDEIPTNAQKTGNVGFDKQNNETAKVGNVTDAKDTDSSIENKIKPNESEQNTLEGEGKNESNCDPECNLSKDNLSCNDNKMDNSNLDCISNLNNDNRDDKDISTSNNKEEETKAEVSHDSGNENKPLIKCVNINKLLEKPRKQNQNISLVEISDSENEDDKKKEKVKSTVKKQQITKSRDKLLNKNKKITKDKRYGNNEKEDEDYWLQKRNEVSQFKAKSFNIAIKKLPKYSEKFLKDNNLKKITLNGVVLNELLIAHVTNDDMSSVKNVFKVDHSNLNVSEINNTVKHALLNDSDCDKSHSELIETTKKAISALLNDSSSDDITKKNENIESKSSTEDKQIGNTIQNAENEDTPELKKSKSDEEREKIKTSLMKDSSDENSVSINEKKRKRSESLTPSKRKHIMESMHAKKMLLTYSSSSDTEDEQLRNALKEIRNSLLNGSDDESTLKTGNKTVQEESQTDEISKKRKQSEESDKSKLEEKKPSDSSDKDANVQAESSAEESVNSSSKKMSESNSNGIGSSCKNSDTQDSIDKDIDGLTNLNTLKKRQRRRRSSSSDSSTVYKTRSSTRRKMPKVPQISEEGFLKAEDSSDAASVADSEPAEELPTVPMSGLNGDSISHLAKDELLGDSDSSTSHTEKDTASQDTQKEESSDENVKSKRRKANAISSDSEAGSSRKKDKNVRLSDFEDTADDDSSEPAKKAKRKKKGSESDASASSSIDGSKKKRRRIKNVDDSDNSGSETENEGKNKHGRKNIRKVMGKNQLEEATKKAAREEKERIARIAERQKLYNNLEFDESGKPDEVVLDKVVLDFDPDTKEPLIEVDKGLVKKLKPHQANGIKFMWNACFESVKRIKKDKGSGCILAHCMGLGKTLQVVSLTHTLLTHGSLTGVRRVLVVCPLSTVLNWVNEFRMWLKHTHSDYEVDVYELSRYKQNSERAYQLQCWFQGGGVCVLGYEMFRNLSADNVKKFKKKMLRNFQESLVDPGPDLVVCDEGHLLKNEKTSLSQAMNRVCTLRRIVLTGTPLQNNLKEYYCMVQFVKPNLLGKYNEYLNRFVNPITNGQYTDSTEHDIRVMKRRSHVLHKMLDGAVQRRDYGVLAPFLPPKHEYVLFITLSDVQVKLYQEYLDNYSRRPLPGKSSGFLFPDFQSLQRIWTHPLVLKYNSERYEIMQQKKREREEEDSEGSLVDFIDDESTAEETSSDEESEISSDMSDDSRKKSKKKKSNKKSKGKDGKAASRRGTRANPIEAEEEDRLSDVAEVKQENPTEWWVRLVGDEELEDLRNSHKLVLLFDILRQCETIGDKLLVFSQSLYSLDLIEHFLGKVDEATQDGRVDEKLNGHVGSWSPGVDYFRLDGSTSCENRSIWCKNFNREDNPRARLFLISTRAGGLGINLVAANRVVIFDVSWNPSHDVQSIFRVYRFGQKKPCYIYRFLAMGTMEEKIYERQVTKQAISKRVIDEQQIDRHYAENDLAELYKFEPRPPAPRELPPLPKDRLFAEMLREHELQIYKYHEHDSLLENKEEETLTEEERKAAWEDFENEKTRPPPQPFAGYTMHNGMMPGLLAQQQQQLAYAALAAMLRKDMPNMNDNQIRDMLPMIYNSNPQLMQKMSEVYKYAPGMMNPAMMNQVMNAGSGMGGSSGLQYEPPWQRQQQQQQQMRLQQLMQQQQNMGAKMYAGGLGSRDPVAMALQQQRARELMLGERARPRGRPPARTSPPAPGDVVNLDSD